MARLLTLFLLPVLALGLASCGGDDDGTDDSAGPFGNGGDNGGDDGGDGGDDGNTDSSDAKGSLTLDGEEYTLDMLTCELSLGDAKLTVLAGTLEGESDGDFSASGIENAVSIAVRAGDSAYIAAAAELDRDGSTVSWSGPAWEPANPAKQADVSFSVKC